MSRIIMEYGWANLQFRDFNSSPQFQEALRFLKEQKVESLYLDKEAQFKKFKEYASFWSEIWSINRDYLDKNAKKIFEYKYAYEFYYMHLAINTIILHLISSGIKGDLKTYIEKIIINEMENFKNDSAPNNADEFAFTRIGPFYLALKWFYNEKTKKYYSDALLEEMKKYENFIENAMNPHWREKVLKYEHRLIKWQDLTFRHRIESGMDAAELIRFNSALGLSLEVKDEAACAFNFLLRGGFMRGSAAETTMAGCIYYVCIRKKVPIDLGELSESSCILEEEIMRIYKRIVKILKD